ncbi:chemotaxis response regulator protein-glutamate methylesterase [Vibrio alginolyticus]|nr:chemotaxis response regulator protein-glutamate methylesterase [Vibrio alginolyticus]
MKASKKIKVFIVDDSAVVRQLLQDIFSETPDIEVSGVASDPLFAIEKMRGNWPDVFIVDVEMPRMDGISFLKKIMASRPTPVVICSSFSSKGAETTLEALSAGAVSYVTKPKIGLKGFLETSQHQITEVVRVAASSKIKSVYRRKKVKLPLKVSTLSRAERCERTANKVVAIGCSTGGTGALESILSGLTPDCPGMVIVQHMPEKFTAAFADRLNSRCQIEVKEAENGDRVRQGLALIAPGGKHMSLVKRDDSYVVKVKPGPAVNRHCPSVDVLFNSVAKCCDANAAGFILTGMGSDGAKGMKSMFDSGCTTYAQNEDSCVVFGMPREAIKKGGVKYTISLDDVADAIFQHNEN